MKNKTRNYILIAFAIILIVFAVMYFRHKIKYQGLGAGKNKQVNSNHKPDLAVFTQFKGKPKEAIKFLMKAQKGECTEALYREDLGYIDIIWGENDTNNKGFGLKHIIEKHGESIKKLGFNIEDFIPIVVQFGNFNESLSNQNKKVYESDTFRFVVSLDLFGKSKRWLLTAFDITKKP